MPGLRHKKMSESADLFLFYYLDYGLSQGRSLNYIPDIHNDLLNSCERMQIFVATKISPKQK